MDDLDLFGAFDDDTTPSISSGKRSLSNGSEQPAKRAKAVGASTPDASVKAALALAMSQRESSSRDLGTSNVAESSIIADSKDKDSKCGSYEAQALARESNEDAEKILAKGGVVKGGAGTSSKNCIHEVELPENYPQTKSEVLAETQTPPTPLIHKYGFELDPFQKHSVACIEKGHSVLVAAHTSAGKTAVAEYAIKRALLNGATVIYTSPIKALSNQKYRDLYETFDKDVGLMTGDVTINPGASCLVMTTEILRSMLYRGSEIMREVAWVIYDEVHYMRDKERGVVWEESMIMLPHKVRFVFLSATIPNSPQFASWIAKVHDQPCHVVYTEYRPTPLVHYMFPSGGDGLHLVVDENGKFREKNFQKAVAKLSMSNLEMQVMESTGRGKKSRKKSSQAAGSDLFRIIKLTMDRKYGPVIVFSFSKRECETYALQLAKMDLNDSDEKSIVAEIFTNAIESLSEDDRRLPQVDAILPLLKRGIGIHHGGLLPILKEVIEILFGEETFAMGINMPAKTVVFTAARKFDGTDTRYITAGEYIQMSGRAGHDRGIVIQMIDEKMEPGAARQILKGVADPLNSSFHLGYNMLLNLLRVEEANPEDSFLQFQTASICPKLREEILNCTEKRDLINVRDESSVSSYFKLTEQMSYEAHSMMRHMFQPQYILPFMQPGRLVKIRDDHGQDWGWGVVINFSRTRGRKSNDNARKNGTSTNITGTEEEDTYVAECLLHAASRPTGSMAKATPFVDLKEDEKHLQKDKKMSTHKKQKKSNNQNTIVKDSGEMVILPLLLTQLEAVSTVRIFVPKDLRMREKRDSVRRSIEEVQRRFPNGLPLLDPLEDLGIEDKKFLSTVTRIESLQKKLLKSPFYADKNKETRFEDYKQKMKYNDKIKELKLKIKSASKLIHKDELIKMKRVLRRLGHTDADDVVQPKGQVASFTELLFNSVFNDLNVPTTVALMSVFSGNDRKKTEGDDEEIVRPELRAPLRLLKDGARRIAQVSQESGIDIDPKEYSEKFNVEMMEVAYMWASGSKFSDICKVTEQFEGSIIRSIRRLEEVLRELAAACRAMGNPELAGKFLEGIKAIKRDIVFAASLYL